jgi:hypothetical protein
MRVALNTLHPPLLSWETPSAALTQVPASPIGQRDPPEKYRIILHDSADYFTLFFTFHLDILTDMRKKAP